MDKTNLHGIVSLVLILPHEIELVSRFEYECTILL